MPSTSHPTRKPRALRRRMALPALLIFAPLAVLTAIGLRGVATTRKAAREAAQTETSRWIDQALERLQSGYQNLLQSSHTPELYPLSPTPAARNEAQSLYARALTLPEPEALRLFDQIETQYAEAATDRGIPLLPLAEWAKLQRSSDSAKMREVAEELGRAAVETHPSILTPELLGRAEDFLRARALDPGELTHWRQRWDDDERLRGILRAHESALSIGFPGAWIEADGERWWLASDAANHQVVLLAKGRFRDISAGALSAAFALRPAYASIEITFHGEPILREPVGGERLVEAARFGFDAVGRLAHPDVLYAAQRQQVIWLSTLLACAVGAAAAGYFSLQHALRRERQLHALKSNFVASVSHELRAPVASMRVMAENLGSGIVPGEARQKEYHRLIAEECGRLSTLIENVLDLARIEQDRKAYRFLETDVRMMIEDAVSLMTPGAARRGQRFEVRTEPIEPPPHCDGLAIQRALINLLDNASKFSPADSAIQVRAEAANAAHWILAVADRGPGIAPEERDRIFERFYRIGSELRRETPGAGIGLSVVRHIVEGHGGEAFVEPAPDGGSIFILRLPLQPPAN